MKILSEKFTAGGFLHTQLERDGVFAIYKRSKGSQEHFEVIEIRSHNGYEISGVKIEPAEIYPSAEKWGTLGWTHIDYDGAKDRFNKLRSKGKVKK